MTLGVWSGFAAVLLCLAPTVILLVRHYTRSG
jgi:hypothetical protein